jgi:hypothetical protein
LQGSALKAANDIVEVGKSIGVFVKGDKANMFSALTKAGKGMPTTSVPSKGVVGVAEKRN